MAPNRCCRPISTPPASRGVQLGASAAGGDLVINARVDVHLRQVGPPEQRTAEAIRRGRLYLKAGADCVYPIGVADEATIAELVEGIPGPVNILMRPGVPDLERLQQLGVARVSYGSGLMRVALDAASSSLPGNRGATGDS